MAQEGCHYCVASPLHRLSVLGTREGTKGASEGSQRGVQGAQSTGHRGLQQRYALLLGGGRGALTLHSLEGCHPHLVTPFVLFHAPPPGDPICALPCPPAW